MTQSNPISEAALQLRAASAELITRAESLESLAQEDDLAAPAERLPLEPPADSEEAAVRLIALDAATSGRPRSEVEDELKDSHPTVDSAPLLDRFYAVASKPDLG